MDISPGRLGNVVVDSMSRLHADDITLLTTLKTALEKIDDIVAGSEAQVDIVASVPAGANVIGKVGLDAGTQEIGKLAAGVAQIGQVKQGDMAWKQGNLESHERSGNGIIVTPTNSFYLVSFIISNNAGAAAGPQLKDNGSGGTAKTNNIKVLDDMSIPFFCGDAPIKFSTDVYFDNATNLSIIVTGYDAP